MTEAIQLKIIGRVFPLPRPAKGLVKREDISV